ncbi:phosphoribosylformylglycinamidine synthase subunit PurS [soil metagenome]
MYRATVHVTLRPSILDPQGKAITQALHQLGYDAVSEVRAGKRFEILIDAASESDARELATAAASRLLANTVMEDYRIEIESA